MCPSRGKLLVTFEKYNQDLRPIKLNLRPIKLKRMLGLGGKKGEGPVYRRALWKHISRYFYVLMLSGLNLSTFMLLLGRLQRHEPINIGSELTMFAFLALMDLWILPICVLEVNSLQITDQGLRVGTIFWRWLIPWSDIASFKLNENLVWATMRTKRGFYLINRKDISNFSELRPQLTEMLDSGALAQSD